jgi:hypothetical protein
MQPDLVAALSRRIVWRAQLVEIVFASQTVRLTTLDADLTLPDATTWRGLGRIASISSVEQPSGEGAPSVSLSLSGLDQTLFSAFLASETEARNRPVKIGLAVWSGDDAASMAFVRRITLFSGRIDAITYASSPVTDGEGTVTGRTRIITARVESLFAENRARIKSPLWSGLQQRLFYPGDTGLDQAIRAGDKTLNWPSVVVA